MIFSESIISDLTELVSTEAPFILFCLFVCLSFIFSFPAAIRWFSGPRFFFNEITAFFHSYSCANCLNVRFISIFTADTNLEDNEKVAVEDVRRKKRNKKSKT